MTVFSYTGNVESLSSGYIEERGTFSYDESAVVGLDSTDYGFITEGHTLDDDFGLVTDSTNYAYQRIDYGFLSPDTTIKPFGSIGTLGEFADVALVRNSVGGVVFLMYGSAKIFVLPIHIGRGTFLARGDAAIAFAPQVVGTGSLFTFVSTTTVKASKQDGAGLFKITSTSTHSFTPLHMLGLVSYLDLLEQQKQSLLLLTPRQHSSGSLVELQMKSLPVLMLVMDLYSHSLVTQSLYLMITTNHLL